MADHNTRRGTRQRWAPPWRIGITLAVAAGVVLALQRSRRFLVAGDSMQPTLQPGDCLIVTALPHVLGGLRPGWIVVAQRRDQPHLEIVKRVVAVNCDAVTLAGDNPGRSMDSRHFGAVSHTQVVGVVWLCYWPPQRWRVFGGAPHAVAHAGDTHGAGGDGTGNVWL